MVRRRVTAWFLRYMKVGIRGYDSDAKNNTQIGGP